MFRLDRHGVVCRVTHNRQVLDRASASHSIADESIDQTRWQRPAGSAADDPTPALSCAAADVPAVVLRACDSLADRPGTTPRDQKGERGRSAPSQTASQH